LLQSGAGRQEIHYFLCLESDAFLETCARGCVLKQGVVRVVA
jgi:hypothetical protein